MSPYPPPPSPPPGPLPSGAGWRFEAALERIEMELQHAIDYVNDAVVPQVRAESITAMRKVAGALNGLASRMETPKGPQF